MNSNGKLDKITLNSCQYTPVYLIQNNSITQTGSYVLAPTIKEDPKPVTNNLKLFYENSGGNIEKSLLLNNVQYVSKPPVLNKQVQEPIGNSLKLASFLVPKKDGNKDQYIATISNKFLKPSDVNSDTNALPNFNIVSSKPNGVRNKANAPRTLLKPRILPKIKPKEKLPEPSQHTSVHLLKLGGSYHSLNQLNDQQTRIVNQALEDIQHQGKPEQAKLKPTFDPVTNTKIVYKVVSPNDLKIVGKNKIIIKASAPKKPEIIKDISINDEPDTEEELEQITSEIKVTRSGRTVKLPKHIQPTKDEPPSKARKKSTTNTVTCYQCSTEFPTIFRLQRHYEKNPGHAPTNVHTSLFHCLLAILRAGTHQDKAAIFIEQLEQLVEKLKALLPCLLKKIDGVEGATCNINEDVGRLFGMNPGMYNLNVDALDCVKDNDGCCKHNPSKPTQFNSDLSKPSQLWLSKHQGETANNENEGEDCARINSIDKWPVKRIWKHKLDKLESKSINNKKIKLICDVGEPLIELGNETFETCTDSGSKRPVTFLVDDNDENADMGDMGGIEINSLNIIDKKPKGSHTQFYSTHFDIRSSPIKPSSTVFNKFQIIPEKMPLKFDAQLLRPLSFATQNNENQETDIHHNCENSLDLSGILKEFSSAENDNVLASDVIETNGVSCKEPDVLDSLTFANSKGWPMDTPVAEQSHDNCIKPNNLILPTIMQDNTIINSTNYDDSNYNDRSTFNGNSIATNDNAVNNDSMISDNREALNQGASVLNFLDSLGSDCLTCPENELRNTSIDFSLDLFSFNHS